MSGLEDAIAAHVAELFGEPWPTIAYVLYARVTDPESPGTPTGYTDPRGSLVLCGRTFVVPSLARQHEAAHGSVR